jgi:hypothetical protein
MEYVNPTLFKEEKDITIGNTYVIIDNLQPAYEDEPIATFSGKLDRIDDSYHFINVNHLNKLTTIEDPWIFSPNELQQMSFEKEDYVLYDKVEDIPIDFKNCVSYYNIPRTCSACENGECTPEGNDESMQAYKITGGAGVFKRTRKPKRKPKRKQTKSKKIKRKKTMQIQRRR